MRSSGWLRRGFAALGVWQLLLSSLSSFPPSAEPQEAPPRSKPHQLPVHEYDLTRYGSMFSISGAQHHAVADPQTPDSLPERPFCAPDAAGPTVLQVPSGTRNGALSQIEHLLESIVDAITSGEELAIPYRSVRSTQNGTDTQPLQGAGRRADVVRFPGRTVQEATRFGMGDLGV